MEENEPCSIKSQFIRLTSITLKWHEKRKRNKNQVNEKWQKQLRRQPHNRVVVYAYALLINL